MKKVLFAVKNMNVGGVEKSLLSLLGTLNPKDYQVDVFLLENTGGFLQAIPEWVNVIVSEDYAAIKEAVNAPPLQVIKKSVTSGKIGRALRLAVGYAFAKISGDQSFYYKQVFSHTKKLTGKYDIAVSYTSLITYLTWYVLHYVTADSYIGWIHFDVAKLNLDKRFLYKLHSKMDKINIVSQEARNNFVAEFPGLTERCCVRYNVVNGKEIETLAQCSAPALRREGKLTILTLGRLTGEKGQDIIPNIAKRLKEENVDFCWYLIGDGALRAGVEKKIQAYHLEDCVFLLGTITNPYPYLKQADIYVQTSIHEGFCITLAEAKVFGMPIVSSEFAGAREQLDMVSNARVVNRDVAALTAAIHEAVTQIG